VSGVHCLAANRCAHVQDEVGHLICALAQTKLPAKLDPLLQEITAAISLYLSPPTTDPEPAVPVADFIWSNVSMISSFDKVISP
jgi:hypothetical protein